MNNQDQLEIPIQPVENPILCNPYEEPNTHWVIRHPNGRSHQNTPDDVRQGTGTEPNAQAANNAKCASFKKRSEMTCRW